MFLADPGSGILQIRPSCSHFFRFQVAGIFLSHMVCDNAPAVKYQSGKIRVVTRLSTSRRSFYHWWTVTHEDERDGESIMTSYD